jgi:hypothetical protein
MKYGEKLKPKILRADLGFIELSQIFYSYYKVSLHIENLGLNMHEILMVSKKLQEKIFDIKEIDFLTNKSFSRILVFMREFLYDDENLLQAIIDAVERCPGADFNTYFTLIHTIAYLNFQEGFNKLPQYYTKVLEHFKT